MANERKETKKNASFQYMSEMNCTSCLKSLISLCVRCKMDFNITPNITMHILKSLSSISHRDFCSENLRVIFKYHSFIGPFMVGKHPVYYSKSQQNGWFPSSQLIVLLISLPTSRNVVFGTYSAL